MTKKRRPAQSQNEHMQASGLPEVFTFNPSNQSIRAELINNEPYFVAKDVCEVLGIEKHRDAVARLDEDEKGRPLVVDTLGGKQSLSTVNESGLYNLIFQSRKPEAKSFRKWVTSEVLPAIRKTGKYAVKRNKFPRDGEYVDLRHLPYEFRSIENSQIRVINYEDIDWYNINDICRAIGANTGSCQIVRQLNSGNKVVAIKILVYGNTHPAWFTSITGVKLIFSGSRKIKNNRQQLFPQQIQLAIGGLVQ